MEPTTVTPANGATSPNTADAGNQKAFQDKVGADVMQIIMLTTVTKKALESAKEATSE